MDNNAVEIALTQEQIDDIIANNSGDIYKQIASKAFNIPYENVTPNMRKYVKTKYFGAVYNTASFVKVDTFQSPSHTTSTSFNVRYCPECGAEMPPVFIHGQPLMLNGGGKVYQCVSCGSKYHTFFSNGSMLMKIDEDRYRYLVDKDYRERRDMEDLKRKVEMEEAYEKAAKEHSYELPENYIEEDK